jgi:hypothetical protein
MTGDPDPSQSEGVAVLPGDPSTIAVPSGQEVTLQDVIWNAPGPNGLTLRFRFVAPAIAEEGGTIPFETASQDMAWLCQNYALPRVPSPGPQPAQIIISLSDRPTVFGEAAPDATQFFEAYSLVDGQCVVELF